MSLQFIETKQTIYIYIYIEIYQMVSDIVDVHDLQMREAHELRIL